MKKSTEITILLVLIGLLLPSLLPGTPPEYSISIPTSPVMTSYYDYMIGGYYSSPVMVVPESQGGGLLMAFHANPVAGGTRSNYLAYINGAGTLQQLRNISASGSWGGYPSLDFDGSSGLGFMAWHEKIDQETTYTICGRIVFINNGVLDTLATTLLIFSPWDTNQEYTWPIVKWGPSPNAGMRRVYVIGKRSVDNNGFDMVIPMLAYADVNPSQVAPNTILTWSYSTIPEIEAWGINPTIYREMNYTLLVDNNGSVYLVGNHKASQMASGSLVDESNLEVFICSDYGAGVWRRVSVHDEQLPSMQVDENYTFANIHNSSHFNGVLDLDGNIDFLVNYAYNGQYEDTSFYYPNLHGLQQIHFDTQTETFRMDDLYPQGASPHSEPIYTPWDINEDHIFDEVGEDGYPVIPVTWLFPYWDSFANNSTMFFYYNLQMMTEPNAEGWMACVWEDSWRALHSSHPPEITQPPYWPCPTINISLSPDNGWTWLEPIKLDYLPPDSTTGYRIPMWVYPANKIIHISHTDNTDVGRLYLMFFDDYYWGSYVLSPPVGTNAGGQVSYMAIDITLPYVANDDPLEIPSPITLEQNYPNPVRSATTIKYNLAAAGEVNLCVYNIKGQLVKTIQSGFSKAGEHSFTWNCEDSKGRMVGTGLYFYRLQAGDKTLTRKLLLIH